MNEQFIREFQRDSIEMFSSYKTMTERALAQVTDAEFFLVLGEESNSIATIYKHIGGNLRSRWTDFLTTDGEKPDRDRDSEFIAENDTRESLGELWETGWNAVLSTLSTLTVEDFSKTVTIRGEPFSVGKAIGRSIAHTACHVGQITLLAKHFRGNDWQTLSVPKGKSQEFTKFVSEKETTAHFLEAPQEFAKK